MIKLICISIDEMKQFYIVVWNSIEKGNYFLLLEIQGHFVSGLQMFKVYTTKLYPAVVNNQIKSDGAIHQWNHQNCKWFQNISDGNCACVAVRDTKMTALHSCLVSTVFSHFPQRLGGVEDPSSVSLLNSCTMQRCDVNETRIWSYHSQKSNFDSKINHSAPLRTAVTDKQFRPQKMSSNFY